MSAAVNTLELLIIEDNQGDYYLLEEYLLEKNKDVRLTHSSDFTDACRLLTARTDFAAIFLDLHLPEISGLELAWRITTLRPETPVIVLTGYADLDIARACLSMGVSDFLIKDEINAEILYKSTIYAIDRNNFIKSLENARANYEHVFNFSPQPMWICEYPSYKIIQANHATIRRFGYSHTEIQQMTLSELFPEIPHSSKRNESTPKDGHNQLNLGIHPLTTKTGETLQVELFGNEITYQDISARIYLANDITERMYHLQTIEDQNIQLKKIAWTQSHIVRAPLSRIMGIIHLIELQSHQPEDLEYWISQMKSSAMEMDNIIRQIVERTKGLNIKSSS